MTISVPYTPTLKSGVTVNGGTSIFEDNCYLGATASGGSSVSLTHIGGTVGIDDVEMEGVLITSQNGNITVEGCDNCEVSIFDMQGRQVSSNGLPSGVYIVKVGNHLVRKVVVTR